tara:strand:+ start:160 stop:1737 length:1578 start_codon:yes stop_codon:yes gene_type:complete
MNVCLNENTVALEEMLHIVSELYEKYKENKPVQEKLIQNVTHTLPEMLKNTDNTIVEREKRRNYLETESDIFNRSFLHKNKYYYHTTSEMFFEYTNDTFSIIKEDDIQHKILTSISSNKHLLDWKYKLKVNILKKIKDRDIFSCIPESSTIQNVIKRVSQSFALNRISAKYFLTILGDVLLKKDNHIYFISPKTKTFLKELSNLSCIMFGTPNLFNIFKFKYYDHKLSDCRIVKCREYIDIDSWSPYFKKTNALDLFCVAAHYSWRFKNADRYLLEHSKDEALQNYSMFLKNNTEDDIVTMFMNNNIEKSDDCSISWKNMFYLWKQFISIQMIPNMFFTANLKNKLITHMQYNSEDDKFMCVTSKNIPNVIKFKTFWEEHITYDIHNNEELEIDELSSLFYANTKQQIHESTLMDLIKHFYPDVQIEDDKYLLNINCNLWVKPVDISIFVKKYFLDDAKMNDTSSISSNESSQDASINQLYEYYSTYCKNKFIVSKRYFEKYMKFEYATYIYDENFVKSSVFEIM